MKKRKNIIPIVVVLLALAIVAALLLSRCDTQPEEMLHGSTSSSDAVVSSGSIPGTTGEDAPGSSAPATTVAGTQPANTTQPTTQPTTLPATKPTTQPATKPTTQPATKPNNTQSSGCAHNWDEWTVIKLATCGIDGEKVRGCPKCSATEFAPVPAFGHTWGESKVETVSSSCGETTTQVRICKTCQHEERKTTQITGSHTFGAWEYEEFTYQVTGSFGKVYTHTSHRKVRFCTKCNYKESDNTENHVCTWGAPLHNVTAEYQATCLQIQVYRSTCTFCGWSTTFDRGEYGNHNFNKSETRHLTDYTEYTDELDVTISTCAVCDLVVYNYTYGKGSQYYSTRFRIAIATGTAYGPKTQFIQFEDYLVKHPTWQRVRRNEILDAEGYLIQWDEIWHDENGNRYSQTIYMDEIPAMFERAGYDLSKYEGYASMCYQLIIDGDRIRPWRITFSG